MIFPWYFDPFYGNCWIFNSGYNKTDFWATNEFVYKFLQKSNYIIYSYPFTGGGLGAVIRIENGSYLTGNKGSDGIKISPGFKTSVSVSRSFKSNLPRPYRNCLIDNETNAGFRSELFDLIQSSKYSYTLSICFGQCFQRAIQQEYNCTDPMVKSLYSNVSECFTIKEINYMQLFYVNSNIKQNLYSVIFR